MKNGLVSIILPIYGVEKYLNRCMESIVNQTYKNIEIIMVDDGSKDTCPEMCDNWAKRDSRVKVIHKRNEGLGMARNTGIENAVGEYICFFDSDDYVSLDAIEKVYNLIKQNQSDIVIFGLNRVNLEGDIVKKIIPSDLLKSAYKGDAVQKEFLPKLVGPSYDIWMSSCVCLYSLDIIKKSKWRFASEREIISEDVYSLLNLYSYIENVSILREALYFYCENQASLTQVYRSDRYYKIKDFYNKTLKLCEEKKYNNEVKEQIKHLYLSFTLATLKQVTKSELINKQKKQICIQIMSDIHFHSIIDNMILNGHSRTRKIFINSIKKKYYLFAYFLVLLQVLREE